MNKITDTNGRTTIIENGVLYTVIYSILAFTIFHWNNLSSFSQ